jgi:hypothetical protein
MRRVYALCTCMDAHEEERTRCPTKGRGLENHLLPDSNGEGPDHPVRAFVTDLHWHYVDRHCVAGAGFEPATSGL